MAGPRRQAGLCFWVVLVSTFSHLVALSDPSWNSTELSSAPAAGGSFLPIRGQGFRQSGSSFYCLLKDGASRAQSRIADIEQDDLLVCILPSWPFPATVASLVIVRDGVGPIAFVGSDQQQTQFEYLEGWQLQSPSNPVALPASGGTELQFVGYGLDTAVFDYTCMFSRGEDEVINVTARAVNATLMACTAPAWGTTYSGSWTSVSVNSNLDADSPVNVALFRNGVEMRRTRPGTNRRAVTRPCTEEACTVRFYALWTEAELDGQSSQHLQSAADGGGNISISGFGFNADEQYFCVFDDGVGNVEYSTPASPSSPQRVNCIVPVWPHPAATCSFTLHVLHTNGVQDSLELGAISSGGAIFTLTFLPEWYSVGPAAGPARGGTVLTFLGQGFDASNRSSYQCVFTSEDGEREVSSGASAVNETVLQCQTARWPWAAESVNVSLRVGGATVLYLGAEGAAAFAYAEGWDLRTDNVTAGPASGGTELAFEGDGFGGSYECWFAGVLRSSAVVASSSRITCLTPAWGSGYAATTVVVSLVRVGGGAVPFLNGGMEPVATTEANCDPGTCIFAFDAVWQGIGVTAGSSFGGTRVAVHGFGFDVGSRLYVCRWAGVDNVQDSAPSPAFNVSTVRCESPAWSSGAGLVTVSLLNVTSLEVAGSTDQYEFLSSWVVKNVSEAPAVGGQGLQVRGIGFDVNSEYSCVFTGGPYSVSTAATVPSGDTILCSVPRWRWGAQDTTFSVVVNGMAVLFAGSSGNETRFVFTQGHFGLANSSAVEGVASGGDLVMVDGYGFVEGAAYNCTFFRVRGGATEAADSVATVIDPFTLSCLSPPWGSDYGAGLTGVGVEDGDGALLRLSDESLTAVNTTQCFAGAGLSRCSFLFSTIWDNTQTSPTQFLASGGTTITLRGAGFVPLASYACQLARGAYSVNATGQATSSGEVECVSPPWRSEAVPNAQLDLAFRGSPVARLAPSFVQDFNILPVVTSIAPTFGAATGGDTILVSGNGFSPSRPYLCELQGVQFSALYFSDIELQCTVPVQPWIFGDSLMVFFEAGAPLSNAVNLSFSFGALAISVSQDFGNRLGGVGTENTHASSVTVAGAGFFSTYLFACRFTLLTDKTQLPRSELPSADLQARIQGMRRILNASDAASCPCPGGCRSFQYGSVSDGFAGQYPRETRCYWLLAPVNASSLSVSFPAFDTELNFDLLTVWSCDDLSCSTPTLLNVLSGAGPPAGSHIVSPTGIVLITFESDRLLQAEGFTAEFAPAAAQSTFSLPTDSESFTCTLPVWDASTPWTLFQPTATQLRVLTSQDGGSTSSVVAPSRGAAGDVLSNFTFFQVNQPPSFEGSSVHVVASLQQRPVQLQAWAGTILVGTDDFNRPIPAELDQQVTFDVVLSGQDLFTSPPAISADGTLTFTVAPEEYGVAVLFVTLRDDGSTAYGGIDAVSKAFQIEVVTEPPFQDAPQFDYIMEIRVAESSGPHVIVDAVTSIAPGVINNLVKTVNVSVSSDFPYFAVAPYLDDSTLYFQVLPFVSGSAYINVTVVASDPNSNATSSSSASIHVIIQPVNSQPSFELVNTTIVVDESSNGTRLHSFPEFASAITTGPGIGPGPNGEDWSESLQTVTFSVVGTGRPFAVQPRIAANGTLSFVLAADVSGTATFQVSMQDSGGTLLGGVDSSDVHTFTIEVRLVNDAPSFDVNCMPALAVGESFACNAACAAKRAGCRVSINVDENCINCLETGLAECEYDLVVEHFAQNILTSAIGAPEEDSQRLSFAFAASNDSLALLESAPTIDPDSGTLTLCLKESANGNATLEIRLLDDGGSYGGGVDRTGPVELHLQVFSVNQQPSLALCSDCVGACCNAVGQCCGPSLVVWDASGFHSKQIFNGVYRGWLDADGNDAEAFQALSFTITPLNLNDTRVFVREPFIHENGTLEFEFAANISGVFDFAVFAEDDGYADDVAAGTVERNLAQGTAYGGINKSVVHAFSIVVSDSFALVCYNASLNEIHANASIAEQGSIYNSSLLAAQLAVTSGLGFGEGRVLLESTLGGFCLKVLGSSVQETLSIVQQAERVTQLVLAGINNATAARRSLLSIDPDVVVSFVSATPFRRDLDNAPRFDLANESHTFYSPADPFAVPKICGYAHNSTQPFVLESFVGNVVSPPNSPMDDEGNVLVFFDIVPVRHRLRETLPWVEDGTDGGIFDVGPLVLTNCPSSCANASEPHVGCQLLPTCREGALVAVQNELAHGEAEYRIQLRGSNESSYVRILSHRFLRFRKAQDVVVRNESLDNETVTLSDFFFATSRPGDGSFNAVNFSIECLDCDQLSYQRFSLFAQAPAILISADNGGDLVFMQRAGMFGNVTLRATMSTQHPDVCEIDHLTQNVTLSVLPVNNAPFFRFNCSVDPTQVECPVPCNEPSNNCSAVVSVEENCRFCAKGLPQTCSNDFALQYFVDPTSLAPSRPQYLTEARQNMTFMVTPLESDENASLLLFAEPPSIDSESGALTFCLRDGSHGNVTFAVRLMDSGGEVRGGVDVVGTALLTVVVYPVNDQPSFDICSDCFGSCCSEIAQCCGPHLVVWESSGFNSLQSIINAIRPGNESYPAVFAEGSQLVTFSIDLEPGVSSSFVRQPHVYNNGTLEFEFRSNVSGLYTLDIFVEDDGFHDDVEAGTVAHNLRQGTAYAGVNKSTVVPLTIVVSNSYVLVEFLALPHNPVWNSSTMANATANTTSVHATGNATNVNASMDATILNTTNGTMGNISSGTGFMSGSNLSQTIFSGSLLEARLAVSRGLGINVGRVLVLERKANGFVLQIVGSSVSETLAHVRNASSISAWVRESTLQYDVSFVSAQGYMKDLEHLPAYTAANTTLLSFAMEYPEASPWVLEHFLTHVVSPPDSPIDDEGRRLVFFQISPVLHRVVVTSPWLQDGTDGGLALLPPQLDVLCDAEGDRVCHANLSLWKDALVHGQAVYEMKMLNTRLDLATNFSLSFVFSHLKSVEVRENAMELLFPEFVRSIIDPEVPFRPLTEFDFVASGPFEDANFVLQTIFAKETTSDRSFALAPSAGSGFPVFGVPTVELLSNGFGELSFSLIPYGNGNVTFDIAFSPNGAGGEGVFTVVVLSVNQAPVFQILQPRVSVLQHAFSFVPYVDASFASSIATGPAGAQFDERNQSLSFSVLRMDGNRWTASQENMTYPIFVAWPLVFPNGTLTFMLRDDWFGVASFRLHLADDGGTARGGADMSFVDFELEVLHTNHAPTFDLSAESVAVLENSGLFRMDRFAQNISTGMTSGPELEQLLTFSLIARFCNMTLDPLDFPLFSVEPLIHVNGTIEFRPADDMFGSCTYDVFLFDDGGTERNGINFSVAVLEIIVELVNDAPRFALPEDVIVVEEDQDGRVHVFPGFATDIAAGPPSELLQEISFRAVVIDSALPYDAASQLRPGSSVYLFEPRSEVQVFPNGTLRFELAPFRNGRVTFGLVLEDDGGTLFGGSNATVLNFTLEVLPVNSQPNFTLPATVVFVEEGGSGCAADPFAVGVDQGGWAEFEQRVAFEFAQTSGPSGVVAAMYAECAGAASTACSHPAGAECASGRAFLRVELSAHRFGNMSFNVTLRDDGDEARGGVAERMAEVVVSVVPRNSPPSFRLAEEEVSLPMGSAAFMENFAFAISLGPWEDALLEGCDLVGFCLGEPCATCEQQTGEFSVNLTYQNASGPELFLEAPRISYPEGVLSFKLNPDVVGIAWFDVVLTDSGALDGSREASEVRRLQIISEPALTFRLCTPVLEIFEGSGAVSKPVAVETREESIAFVNLPSLFYSIAVDNPQLFAPAGQPALSPEGILSFVVDGDYGDANITVWLRDDGGTDNGRQDRSDPQFLIVRILPVNDQPSFSIEPSINVAEASGRIEVPNFATRISPGPRNENCESTALSCEPQSVTFVVVGINGISFFQSEPRITANGTLLLDLAPGVSGAALVSVQLVDDGNSPSMSGNQSDECGPAQVEFPDASGRNRSEEQSFVVSVDAVNTDPGFEFPWRVRCDLSRFTPGCSCAPFAVEDAECIPHDTALIETRESVGFKEIENFAMFVSPAEGFYPRSMATYDFNVVDGDLAFNELRGDPITLNDGFAYAVDYTFSPDKRFVFAAEYETDTVAVFAVEEGEDGEVVTTFVDRRTEKQNRLNVVGFGDDVNPNDRPPRRIDSDLVCDWEPFQAGDHHVIGGASGCEELEAVTWMPSDEPCGIDGLGADCDYECCRGIWNATKGFWQMETKAMFGAQVVNEFSGQQEVTCTEDFCTYTRPRFSCGEFYRTSIGPATIADKVGTLGAAVLTGPNCKNFFNADWDGPTTSVESFMINDGINEAMQFDGILHTGMYITDDIRGIVNQFPADRMSAEVWFTIEAEAVAYGGLVAVQQDGGGCRRGWSLAYDVEASPVGSQVTFYVSVATADDLGTDEGKMTVVTYSEMLVVGRWYHLLGVYNGSHVYLYLDGVERSVDRACSSADCGPIIYAESHSQLGTCIVFGSQVGTPFTIGTYENRMNGGKFPHIGSIHSVRLMDAALSAAQAAALHNASAGRLRHAPTLQAEYWVKGIGDNGVLGLGGPNSPNHDFGDAQNPQSIDIVGSFSTCREYVCRFTYSDPWETVYTVESEPGTLSCTLQTCLGLFADTLTCQVPQWFHGFKATVMSVSSFPRANETNATAAANLTDSNASVPVDSGPTCYGSSVNSVIAARGPGPVWQKVCLTAACGFTAFGDRSGGQTFWYLYGGTYALHPQLKGSTARFRFVEPSSVFWFDLEQETLVRLPPLDIDSCALGSCQWEKTTCQSGPSLGVSCSSESDCGGFQCSSVVPKEAMGSRSFTYVEGGGRRFLLAARGWDGLTASTQSPVFEVFVSERSIPSMSMSASNCSSANCTNMTQPDMGTPPIDVELALVQHVPTAGAGNWKHASVDGREIVVISELLGPSAICPWNPTTGAPVDEAGRLEFHPAGASKVEVFMLGNRTYVAASTYTDGTSSSVYEIQALGVFQVLSLTHVLDLDTPGGAHDVLHLQYGDEHFLAFAIGAARRPSWLYKCADAGAGLQCEVHQSLSTTAARAFQRFEAGSNYLLIAQDQGSKMLRWNGTVFQGEITADTLPSDTAAGLELPTVSRTLEYFGPLANGTARDFFLAGRFAAKGADGAFTVESYLWRGFQEVISGMDGPVSVQLSPVDGSFIYVAAELSQVISIFVRQNRSGTIQYLEDQVFVEGLQHIAISPDQRNLYATAYLPGSIVAFEIENTTGRLVEIQRLSNSEDWEDGRDSIEGLAGATGLFVSPDGGSVYVAGYLEDSVVAFARDARGYLHYADRLLNGERSIVSFHDVVNRRQLDAPQSDEGGFPKRLPGTMSNTGPLPARGSTAFKIGDVLYLAVAFSDAEPGNSEGSAMLYAWHEDRESFEQFDRTQFDRSASCVEHVPFSSSSGGSVDYLLVGNDYHGSGGGIGISMYQWDGSSFAFRSTFGGDRTMFPLGLYPSALRHFTVDAEQYVAVSCYRDEASLHTRSYVLKVQKTRVQGSASTSTTQMQLSIVQGFDTHGASDVVFWQTRDGHDVFLAFANFFGDEGARGSTVQVYRFDAASQTFAWTQAIAAHGASDLEVFFVPDVGDLLAIASRQVEVAVTVGDLPNYDAVSEIYRFDGSSRSWELFQRLDDVVPTLMEESGFDLPDGTYESVYSQYFCRPHCTENASPRGVKLSLPRLRGVTSIRAFHTGGEAYLAIAQSVCDRDVSVARCARTMPQPQSAILQFNRQAQRFGEMLAAAPGQWSGGRRRLSRLERALRIDSGRTSSFEFVEAGGVRLLVATSLSSGAVLYEWEFSVVTGLAGATSVTCTQADDLVLTVSRADRAVVTVRRELYLDDLGRTPATCSDARCLHIAEVLSETPKRVSRLQAAELVRHQGLSSAAMIKFWNGPGTPCAPGSQCLVAVTGRQPRDELPCLSYPPVRADPSVAETIHVDAQCQDVEFRVSWINGDNPDLFERLPSIDPRGTLTFQPRVAQQGTATFGAFLLDSLGGMSATRVFTIAVLEVNRAPFFTSVDAVANAGQGMQSVVFAVDVSAGLAEDQELVWSFSYSSDISIGDQVSMSVVDTASGKVGVLDVAPPAGVSGSANFSVFLSDFGPSDVERGDVNRSQPQTFILSVRQVNLPPILQFPSTVELLENGGEQSRSGFVRVVSLGSDDEATQAVTLSVFDVQPDASFFRRLEVLQDGTLEFEVAQDRNGVAQVTLKAQDDGGTALGGVDASFAQFAMEVQPRNSPPAFSAAADLVAISSVYEQSIIAVEHFLVLLPPPADEAVQQVTFSVESVTNQALFSSLPVLSSSGTLTFGLTPERVGQTVITIVLKDDGGVELGGQDTVRHEVSLDIVSGLRDPDFRTPEVLDYVEAGGPATIPSYLTENGIEPVENFHSISFSVSVAVSNSRLFVALPLISPEGVLTFTAHEEEFGQATLNITAHFTRRLLNDNIPGTLVLPPSVLRVLPFPRVVSISPNVGSGLGGTRVTIAGDHMGSFASKDNVTVTIGGRECHSLSWVSRVQLSCISPPGLGPSDIVVAVGQGLSYRFGVLEGGFTHAVLYYGGTNVSADLGYLAAAPSTAAIERTVATGLRPSMPALSTTVNAIETWRGAVIVAASFEAEDEDARRAPHILRWDGEAAFPLGYGLDGPVNTLAEYQGLLVVGGVFTAAYQAGGEGALKSGGMVGWNGEGWVRVAGATLQGSLSATLVSGAQLYVAGAFRRLGEDLCEGLAVLNGSAWSCPWGAVQGGTVREMVLWRGALVLGGSFATVGGRRAGKLGRWEQGRWIGMGESIDGVVHCLAHQEDRLFVGGEFAVEGNSNAVNLAYYSSEGLQAVGEGLERGVYALTLAHNCLYVGGAFDRYAVRLCSSGMPIPTTASSFLHLRQPAVHLTGGNADAANATFETVRMGDGSTLPGPIRVIAHAVGREIGEQTTHTNNFAASASEDIVRDEL